MFYEVFTSFETVVKIKSQKRTPLSSPIVNFGFKIEEQITCVLSGGISARTVDSRLIEVKLKSSLQEALEEWSNEELEDFFSPRKGIKTYNCYSFVRIRIRSKRMKTN